MRMFTKCFDLAIVIMAAAACTKTGSVATSSQFTKGYVSDPNTGCKVYATHIAAKDSVTWNGGCENGYADGIGVITWLHNGKKEFEYRGRVSQGKRVGQATVIWADGIEYKGEYTNGERTGRGLMIDPNPCITCISRYDGDFVDGEMTGTARIWFANGDYYQGKVTGGNIDYKKTAYATYGKDDISGEFLYFEKSFYKYIQEKNQNSARQDFNRLKSIATAKEAGRLERAAIEVAGYDIIWQVTCEKTSENTRRQETRGAFGLTHTGWATLRDIGLACTVTVRNDAPLRPKKNYDLVVVMDYDWEAMVNGKTVIEHLSEKFGTTTVTGDKPSSVSGTISMVQSQSSESMGIVSFNGESALKGYVLKSARIKEVKLK